MSTKSQRTDFWAEFGLTPADPAEMAAFGERMRAAAKEDRKKPRPGGVRLMDANVSKALRAQAERIEALENENLLLRERIARLEGQMDAVLEACRELNRRQEKHSEEIAQAHHNTREIPL